MQGFNSIAEYHDFSVGAKTRIGIIGSSVHCNQIMQSRIGFGSAGSFETCFLVMVSRERNGKGSWGGGGGWKGERGLQVCDERFGNENYHGI